MSKTTFYRMDPDAPITEDTLVAIDQHSGGQRALVPVEPDPALLPEGPECDAETALRGHAGHCCRPPGHDGMHMAITYWGAGIGGGHE